MQSDRHPTRAIRGLTAACGVIAFLGVCTIAFAKETATASSSTYSNSEFGRLQ
jgi:hypothetical protein